MGETYINRPGSRIAVKDIYEDFRTWITINYGVLALRSVTQRQVYDALKNSPNYDYTRYNIGCCLRGIAYRAEYLANHRFQRNEIHPIQPIHTANQPVNNIELPQQLTLSIVLDIRGRQSSPIAPQFIIPNVGRPLEQFNQ